MKKPVIIASFVFIIGIVGGYYCWQYLTSPQYSLQKALKAFKQHDITTFEKYVDIEDIADVLVNQLLELENEKAIQRDYWSKLGEAIGKGVVTLLKPQLVKLVKTQIIDIVETGSFERFKDRTDSDSDMVDFRLFNLWAENGVERKNYKGIEYIKKEGKIAYIGFKFYLEIYDCDLILDLKLRDKGIYWQAAELSNIGQVIKTLNDLEIAKMLEIQNQINQKDDRAFQEAKSIKTIQAYESYIESYPFGRHLIEAKDIINDIKRKEAANKSKKRIKSLLASLRIKLTPLGIKMVAIFGGSFTMGSSIGEQDERPIHNVSLSGFIISATEVTQAQYRSIMGRNPSHFQGDNFPVEKVSWYDAIGFCNNLSKFCGLEPCYLGETCDFSKNGFRLPTEAEWEYACRAGTTTKFYTGDSDSDLDRACWYYGNSGSTTHAVGAKESNAFGLYDMHGNVYEWCNDWWQDYYNDLLERTYSNNFTGPSTGSTRVVRGGSWRNSAHLCRSASRYGGTPGYGYYFFGFRVVCR